MCMNLLVHMWEAHVFACAHECACGGMRLMLAVFLHHSSPYPSRQELLLNAEIALLAGLASLAGRSPGFPFWALRLQEAAKPKQLLHSIWPYGTTTHKSLVVPLSSSFWPAVTELYHLLKLAWRPSPLLSWRPMPTFSGSLHVYACLFVWVAALLSRPSSLCDMVTVA